MKAAVLGIDGVDGPKLWGTGVGGLVAVVGLKAQSVAEHAQMAVGVDETGQDVSAPGVVHRAGLRRWQGGHLPHRPDLSILYLHIAVGDHRPSHGVDHSVEDAHHHFPPFDKSFH